MGKVSLRTASVACLGIGAAIWLLFLMMRFSSLDIRVIPGIGPIMLMALIVALVTPIVATGIAGVALIRQPRATLSWLAFVCAIIAVPGEVSVIMVSAWL